MDLRLKTLRQDKDLSVRECGRRSGVEPSYISRIENGSMKINIVYAQKLAEFFGVTVDYLIGKSAEEIYAAAIKSLKDFYTTRELADGTVTRDLSEEVEEPLRTKIELLFSIDSLQDQESLNLIMDLVRLRSAKEDFR